MKRITKLAFTLITLLTLTSLTVLYGDGWRLRLPDSNDNTQFTPIVKTGMLAIRSIPEGGKVYLNGEAITATNDTITALNPQKYTIQVKKEGFETWEKHVEVYPELVTDITAVLILQSPRLEPLTTTEVRNFALSSDNNTIAFIAPTGENPGIWELSLSGSPINIFRNNASALFSNSTLATPSLGEELWWAPDDTELLVRMNEKGYLLYKIGTAKTAPPTHHTNATEIFTKWKDKWKSDFLARKQDSLSKYSDLPSWMSSEMSSYDTLWSPDNDKFYYLRPAEGALVPTTQKSYELVVVNLESPLPVGEKRLNTPIKITNPEKEHVTWYSDSYHLIIVREDTQRPKYYTISLIRIDGTNETVLYSGPLASPLAYATPAGEKIIVATTLKENAPVNLYGIVIH